MPETTTVYGGRAQIMFHPEKHYYTVTVPDVCSRLFQPSVTTIIGMLDKSNALLSWAVKSMSERAKELMLSCAASDFTHDTAIALVDAAQDSWRAKRNAAADAGSLAHRVLEQFLLHKADMAPAPQLPIVADSLLAPNLTPEIVEQANNSIRAGLKFIKQHEIEVIQAEAPRWSPTHGYVGTGDLIAKVDGLPSVLDWKSGKYPYPEYFCQTAAYQFAFVEEFPRLPLCQRIIANIGRDGKLSVEARGNDTLEDDFSAFLALLRVWRWHQANQGKYSKEPPQVLGPLDLLVPRREAANGAV